MGTETWTISELLVCAMAREFSGEILASGATFASRAAALLAARLHAPDVMTVGPTYLVDNRFVLAPSRGDELASSIGTAKVDIPAMFNIVMSGKFMIWISPAQIDQYGNTNISGIGPHDRPKVALVGSRGVPDDSVSCDAMYYYVANHSPRSLVEQVDFVSGLGWSKKRRELNVPFGQPKVVVTNLGLFDFESPERTLRIRSLHPGVSADTVREQTGFPIEVPADTPLTEPPSEEELRILRTVVDPLRMRDLEFLAGDELQELNASIREAEKRLQVAS